MARTTDRDAMQVRILEAAQKVFFAKGLHASSMAEIAREAGLAKGTLYLHFNNKVALVQAMVAQTFAAMEAAVERFRPASEAELRAGLLALILRGEAELDETRAFFEVLGPSLSTPAVSALIEGFMARFGARLDGVVQALGFAPAPHQGRAMAAMVDGLVLHFALFRPDTATRHAMASAAVEQMIRGLPRP